MADDTTIIEGTVKFRDGKKWKSRWCVMRKLSPVADCVHLQLYRDARARWAAAGGGVGGGTGGGCKAALSLAQYVGCETGFTLDKHSNTLALVCRDLVAVLAFDTRERLIQWQVKVNWHLGEARQYVVVVSAGGGARRVPVGPARLHLHAGRFALTAGAPPRLHGVWELHHLRRFGVVEGRFCFEGGAACGRGEGLYVLVSDAPARLARDFELAAQGMLSPRRPARPTRPEGVVGPESQTTSRLDTRLSALPGATACERAGSPGAEPTVALGDTASVHGAECLESRAGVTLERCMSCMSKLGALSRSSTAALTPGARHFSPAWTMDAVREAPPAERAASDAIPGVAPAGDPACERPGPAPASAPGPAPAPAPGPVRPPRLHLTLNLERAAPAPCPCSCESQDAKSMGIGPYENYDVPRVPSTEIEGEYYDTPKRLKECIDDDLFRMTKSSTSNTLILKKPCGCLLKFGKRRKEPTIVDSEENFQSSGCPCRRVTDWANSWIKLPYCRRNTASSDSPVPNKENVMPADRSALYATVDVSRKARRRAVEIDEGPLANYENLNFALSLEHYENARDVLRRAGVTQSELDAISANLRPGSLAPKSARGACARCGRPPAAGAGSGAGDYLLMAPAALDAGRGDRNRNLPAGYTPMSPIGGFAFHTLRQPARSPSARLLEEKSASNPALCVATLACRLRARRSPPARRPRSSSADSSRFLDESEEPGGTGERGSASSVETLRDAGAARCAGNEVSDGLDPDACAAAARRAAAGGAGPAATANRDSSSSNDSGVSSCSLRPGECDEGSERGAARGAAGGAHFELPLTTRAARRHYRRAAPAPPATAPRRSRSAGAAPTPPAAPESHKCSSAGAEVPLLSIKPLRGSCAGAGAADAHSTSSGASDMSDYIETLSLCSSHSSTDTPLTMRSVLPSATRAARHATSTLRPRSGNEYLSLSLHPPARPPRAPAAVRQPALYTNLP